jgi:hypothetical protein
MRGERGEGRWEREEMRTLDQTRVKESKMQNARYNQASDGAVRRAGNSGRRTGKKRGREREGELGRMNYAKIIMILIIDYLQQPRYVHTSGRRTNSYDCQSVAKPIVSSSWL